jgi:hypothetical protein
MTDGTEPVGRRLAGTAAVAATTLVTVIAGWCAIWTSPLNGDEAYLLISLREWVLRGGLYDRVFSQYGPFYYSLFGLPSRALDARWSIGAGRISSLVLWVVTAALFGLVARVLTRRWVFGVAAQLLAFVLLATLVNEPMHPGALLAFLLAALLADVAWLRPRAPCTADVLAGALVAAIALTKVNVGACAIVALAFALGSSSTRRQWRWTVSALLVALGPAVLLLNGRESWRWLWSAVYVVGALAVIAAAEGHDRTDRLPADLRRIAAGFAAVAVASVAIVLATGTSVPSLVRGVLVRPLDHPRLVMVPVELPTVAWWWLGALVIGAGLWWRARATGSPRIAPAWSGAIRVGAGLALLVSVLGSNVALFPVASGRFTLLPIAALVLVARPGRRWPEGERFARALVAAAAITEQLHAYPVAGSQVSWGVMTAGLAAVVIVADGVADLTVSARDRAVPTLGAWVGAAVCLLLVLVLPAGLAAGTTLPGHELREWWDAYRTDVRMNVASTGWLRVPAPGRADVDATVAEIHRDCGTFLVLGANLAWYLLADRRPPTGFNHPTWPAYLDAREQRATVAAIAPRRRTCLLLNAFGGTLRGDRVVAISHYPDRQLVDWLEHRHWTQLLHRPGVLVLRARDR